MLADGLLILSSLNADVFDCHSRYLALPTLGYLQYATEAFSLYIAVRVVLRRLHEIQREVEVRRLNFVTRFTLLTSLFVIQA
jgi:hypothetical protein